MITLVWNPGTGTTPTLSSVQPLEMVTALAKIQLKKETGPVFEAFNISRARDVDYTNGQIVGMEFRLGLSATL